MSKRVKFYYFILEHLFLWCYNDECLDYISSGTAIYDSGLFLFNRGTVFKRPLLTIKLDLYKSKIFV